MKLFKHYGMMNSEIYLLTSIMFGKVLMSQTVDNAVVASVWKQIM